ncbi:adhesion G protein-coupled receptor B1-like isoform X2 [Mytilus californianus]|uniref:adhesion G protein-coupled receptor B1-like isoform X2 n=1 Tax=Mytilus californianus TaxID=6549 RepID=UPI0022451B63|nr:adhesion G protein-coupled receptor B1-like isoform X2 [Mytilus californianus]
MYGISVIVIFLPDVFGGICSIYTGPHGKMECYESTSSYSKYQWGTCLLNEYIKTISKGRLSCSDSTATYCYYQCMIEVYSISSGAVYDDCACSSGEEYTDSELSLPSRCYIPSGTDCSWYKDCFKRQFSCNDTHIEYALEFDTAFCNLYSLNESFSNHGQQWINEVRKCLQYSILSTLRPWRSLSCTEVEQVVTDSYSQCYIQPQTKLLDVSICHLIASDYFQVFWTVRSTLGQFYHSTNRFIDTMFNTLKNCSESFYQNVTFGEEVRKFDLTVSYSKAALDRRRRSVLDDDVTISLEIVENLATKLKWQEKGVLWFSQLNSNSSNHLSADIHVELFLANRKTYDLNAVNITESVDLDTVVDELRNSVQKDSLYGNTDDISFKVVSVKGCLDSKCETLSFKITTSQTDSSEFCFMNVDRFNTKWDQTKVGTVIEMACTGNYTGTVSRFCGTGGQWEEPDNSQCTSVAIKNLQKQASMLQTSDNTAAIVNDILNELNNLTSEAEDLRSGDMVTSTAILKDISEHVAQNTAAVSGNQLETFGSLCNSLLDDKNSNNWNELKLKGPSSITGLVKSVTLYTKSYTNVIEREYNVVENKNIVIEVGKIRSEDLIVPVKSKISESWISDSPTEITLNKKNFDELNITGYSTVFYRNISKIFPDYFQQNGELSVINSSYDVNSFVADFSIEPTPERLDYPLIIKFQHISAGYSKPFCGFWDFDIQDTPNGAWSTEGSRVTESTNSYTICQYNHTTNFAILMSPVKTPDLHNLPLSIISTAGCIVSIFFLIFTIAVHFVLWRHVRSDRSKILMNLCVALILSYGLFLAGVTRTGNKVVCTGIAVGLHYIFLVDFALMLGEGIQVAIMVVIIFRSKSIIQWLLPLCWILPAVIVSISAGVTKFEGYGNAQYCWLSLESNLIWAFVGPALSVVVANFIILVIMLHRMLTVRGLPAKTLKQKSKAGIKSICVILPLFGVTWVLGVFSVNEDLVVFQYLFAILNSLQGFFVCLFHCFLNKQDNQTKQQRDNNDPVSKRKTSSDGNYLNQRRHQTNSPYFDSIFDNPAYSPSNT